MVSKNPGLQSVLDEKATPPTTEWFVTCSFRPRGKGALGSDNVQKAKQQTNKQTNKQIFQFHFNIDRKRSKKSRQRPFKTQLFSRWLVMVLNTTPLPDQHLVMEAGADCFAPCFVRDADLALFLVL